MNETNVCGCCCGAFHFVFRVCPLPSFHFIIISQFSACQSWNSFQLQHIVDERARSKPLSRLWARKLGILASIFVGSVVRLKKWFCWRRRIGQHYGGNTDQSLVWVMLSHSSALHRINHNCSSLRNHFICHDCNCIARGSLFIAFLVIIWMFLLAMLVICIVQCILLIYASYFFVK